MMRRKSLRCLKVSLLVVCGFFVTVQFVSFLGPRALVDLEASPVGSFDDVRSEAGLDQLAK